MLYYFISAGLRAADDLRRKASVPGGRDPGHPWPRDSQDSSKGGAVETGCSDLYNVIYYFVI